MNTKKCTKCNYVKKLTEFYSSKNGYLKVDSYCKECRCLYQKSRKTISNKIRRDKMKIDTDYKQNILRLKRESHKRHLEQALFNRAKARAKKWNLDFNITIEDIVIPTICPILEIPIIPGTKRNYHNTPSLDRIDNNKGYIKENIRVISMLANSMKNAATKELLIKFSKNIFNYINKD
jgi:hypothetical protein